MINGQIFGGPTVNTTISIPFLNDFSPHSFGITTAEREEVIHEASGSFHWLIRSYFLNLDLPLLPLRLRLDEAFSFTVLPLDL